MVTTGAFSLLEGRPIEYSTWRYNLPNSFKCSYLNSQGINISMTQVYFNFRANARSDPFLNIEPRFYSRADCLLTTILKKRAMGITSKVEFHDYYRYKIEKRSSDLFDFEDGKSEFGGCLQRVFLSSSALLGRGSQSGASMARGKLSCLLVQY